MPHYLLESVESSLQPSDAIAQRKGTHVLAQHKDSGVDVLVRLGDVYSSGHGEMAEAFGDGWLHLLGYHRRRGSWLRMVSLVLSSRLAVLLGLALASLAPIPGSFLSARWLAL